MKRYLSWSGGKDSSASIIVCYEHNIPLDGIIFSEVMFDHSRNISGENPKHIKWIYETAIPIIENMGYTVTILKSKYDYLDCFNRRIGERSKISNRIGKKYGFLIGGMCMANDRLKIQPIRDFDKRVGEHEQIIGIAVDEPTRLARLKPNCRSVLAEYGIIENDTYDICRKYGLLSPLYEMRSRGGVLVLPELFNKGICGGQKGISRAMGRA